MNISLAAEPIFKLFGFEITNTIFTAFIIFGIIIVFAIFFKTRIRVKNPGKLQVAFEMILSGLQSLANDVMDPKLARSLFSFLITFFIFIFVSNWFGLLPFVPAISINKHEETAQTHQVEEENQHEEKLGFFDCIKTQHCYLSKNGVEVFHDSVHLLRAPTSDLSMAIALAIISVVATNLLGIIRLKGQFLQKYFSFKGAIEFFVGILELVSEFGKLISFSFRLFGNVFAGEILLVVITSISIGLATLPFYMLELFVGAIQAFVFFFLTAVFIGLATTPHEH